MQSLNKIKNHILGKIYGLNNLKKSFNSQTKFIIVCGSPRSGTTFLAETIMSQLNGMIIWEPLQDRALSLMKLNIPKRPQLADIKENINLENYLNRLSFGDNLNIYNTWIRNKKFRIRNKSKSFEYVLFKFTRGNGIIDHFMDEKYLSKVSIVRNPFSVIASQIEHHEFKEHPIYSKNFPDIKKIESIKSNIKKSIVRDLAITWCVDYKNSMNSASLKLRYEELIKDINILKKLDLFYENLEFISTISSTYNKQTSNYGSFEDKWKKTIDKNDVKIINKVMNYMEIQY